MSKAYQVSEMEVSVRPGRGMTTITNRMVPADAAHVLFEALVRENDDETRDLLTEGLARILTRLDQDEAARICNKLTKSLVEALTHDTRNHGEQTGYLASQLTTLLTPLNAKDSAQIYVVATKVLADSLDRETDLDVLKASVDNLAVLSERLTPGESARVCGRVANRLLEMMARDAKDQLQLSYCLKEMSQKMESTDAKRICGKAAKILSESLMRQPGPEALGMEAKQQLAFGIRALLPQMTLVESTRLLSESLTLKSHDDDTRKTLESSLLPIKKRLDPTIDGEAIRASIKILETSIDAQSDARIRGDLAWYVASLAAPLSSEEASRICDPLAKRLTSELKTETNSDAKMSLARGLGATVVFLPNDRAIATIRFMARIARDDKTKDVENAWTLYGDLTNMPSRRDFFPEDPDPANAAHMASILIASLDEETDVDLRWFLMEVLCHSATELMSVGGIRFGEHMAKQVAEFVVTNLASERGQRGNRMGGLGALRGQGLLDGLEMAASQLGSDSAEKIARRLSEALVDPSTFWIDRERLAEALAMVSARMERKAAIPICYRAARVLSERPSRTQNARGEHFLTKGLAGLLALTEPKDAAALISERLNQRELDEDSKLALCNGLAIVVARMQPNEAARTLEKALSREPRARTRLELIKGLQNTFTRMDPFESSHAYRRLLHDACLILSTKPAGVFDQEDGVYFDQIIVRFLPGIDPELATRVARECSSALCAERDINEVQRNIESRLNALLNDTSPAEMKLRNDRLFDAMLSGDPWLVELADAEPFPCRLTTQQLVELLKMPTVFSEAREVVLKHLGNRYGRKFVHHWEFVRYAREHDLKLDFTTPPKRPDPKASLQRMIEILDASNAR